MCVTVPHFFDVRHTFIVNTMADYENEAPPTPQRKLAMGLFGLKASDPKVNAYAEMTQEIGIEDSPRSKAAAYALPQAVWEAAARSSSLPDAMAKPANILRMRMSLQPAPPATTTSSGGPGTPAPGGSSAGLGESGAGGGGRAGSRPRSPATLGCTSARRPARRAAWASTPAALSP